MDTEACDLFRRCLARRHDDDWYEFTRRYGPRVRSMIWRAMVRHGVGAAGQEIEEYVQELYLKVLLLDERGFRGSAEWELWRYLARIVENLVIDGRRTANRERQKHAQAGTTSAPGAAGEAAGAPLTPGYVAPPEPSPERRAIARQRLRFFVRRCRRAAHGMKPELTMPVVRLAFFEGCSSREIARRMSDGLKPDQVDALIHRLRRRLAREGVTVGRRRTAAVVLSP